MSHRVAKIVLAISLLLLTVPEVAQSSQSRRCPEGASGAVVGVVTDEMGETVPGTRVVVGSHQPVTDEHGEFVAQGVCQGRYLVTFAPPMDSNLMADVMYPAEMVTVKVTAGKVTRIRRVLRAGGRIELSVNRDGVLLTPEAMEGISRGGSIQLFSDKAVFRGDPEVVGGRFAFWGLEPRNGYRLEFELYGFIKYVRRGLSVTPGQTTSVVIDFAPDQSTGVAGTLISEPEIAATRKYLSVAHEVNPDWAGATFTDQEGRFSVLGLPPGEYVVSTYGHVLGRVTVSRGEITMAEFQLPH